MLLFPAAILTISDESDRDFMKHLYINHAARMFRVARALTDSKQDAEDVVGEACVALIRKISLLRTLERNVLEGYIISTVKNAAYALHRRRKSQKEADDGETILPQIADDEAAPDARILQQCTMNALVDAMQRLPEADQVAIRMKYFEQRSAREIAAVLGIQEGHVRVRLNRARKRLYDMLREMRSEAGENADAGGKYEAAALELAAYRLMQREQDDIDTPDDAAAESMPRMLKMIDRQLTKKQRHDRFWKQTVRVLKTAAMVVLVLNMALTIVVASTGKVQVRFLDLVMQVNDSYMDIRYQPTETEATMPEDWKTNYFPSYIPDGYTLAQYVSDENFGFLEYRNEQGERMEIHIGGKGAGINLNSKGAEIDHVSLHNTVATVLYQASGSVDLVWSYGDQYFVVEACDYATAYAVAQGLKIIWK